jgi:GrpB-like predicted nucleotidyltransferase (UPF0157 family)
VAREDSSTKRPVTPVLAEQRPTVVVPYDPAWPRLFEEERAVLEAVLGAWLEGGIHHIGSTAVPGLAAKPIIDMVAGVHDLDAARAAFAPLQALGYQYREHRPEAHLFVKSDRGVHLTQPGSDLWLERLAFRDALRSDTDLARAYAEWKREHASRDPTRDPYTADKRSFILPVLQRVGLDLKRDEERLAPTALAAKRRR